MSREELEKARTRIGNKSHELAEWLVQFAGEDLRKLSEGRLMDLEQELRCFILDFHNRRSTHAPDNLHFLLRVDFAKDIVASFQASLRRWLESLTRNHAVNFEPIRISLVIHHPGKQSPEFAKSDLPKRGLFHLSFDSVEQAFAYNTAQVLNAHANRFRHCTECGRLYFADRHQQVFCSPRCLNRVTQRRWRKAKLKLGGRIRRKTKPKGGQGHGKKRL